MRTLIKGEHSPTLTSHNMMNGTGRRQVLYGIDHGGYALLWQA